MTTTEPRRLDEYDRIRLAFLATVRGKLNELAARVARWEPAPMPEGWRS